MAQSGKSATVGTTDESGATRRDFLYYAGGFVTAFGVGAVAWPLIDSMNPAADTLALSSIEIDLSPIEPGQSITVKWRGKPVFIRRRTPKEVEAARNVSVADLPDPQTDDQRVKKGRGEWLILIGVCTHLGCIPLGQRSGERKGEYGGWFCPCHGSHYDTSGRIRKGPAPKNLEIPEYSFLPDNKLKIG